MAFNITPAKERDPNSRSNSPWGSRLASNPATPKSYKKTTTDDIIFVSKSELEKEFKAFINLFSDRKSNKELDTSTQLTYIKKMISNITIEYGQIEGFDNFSDASRSPGHRKSPSIGFGTDHFLKLRNFQLERDRSAYEEKIQNHGQHITDLEEQISKLIVEYRRLQEEKMGLQAELDGFRKYSEASELMNTNLRASNEENLKKNGVLIKEVYGLRQKVTEVEERTKKEINANKKEKEEMVKVNASLSKEVESLKEILNESERDSNGNDEILKKNESLMKEIEVLNGKIVEMENLANADIKEKIEELSKLSISLKEANEALEQRIVLNNEQAKKDIEARERDNENLSKQNVSLREGIKGLQKQLMNLEEQTKKEIESKQLEKGDLLTENASLKTEIDNLKEEVLRLEKENIEVIQKEREEISMEIIDLRKQVETLVQQQVQLEEQAKKDVEMKQISNEDLFQQNISLREDNDGLHEKLIELEKDTKKNIELKEKEYIDLSSERAQLKDKIKGLESRLQELEIQSKREVELREKDNEELSFQNLTFREDIQTLQGKMEKETEERDIAYGTLLKQNTKLAEENQNLKEIITELDEQAKKDIKIREDNSENLSKLNDDLRKENESLQRQVSELEDKMEKKLDLKQSENEEILNNNTLLRRQIDIIQGRVMELEEQIHEEAEARRLETEMIEDMERVKQENERLTAKLNQKENAVDLLTSEKGRLLKEIGGLIDSIRKENEDEEMIHETDRLHSENASLLRKLEEKEAIIQILKEEGGKLMKEVHVSQTHLENLKTKKEEEIKEIKRTYELRESQILQNSTGQQQVRQAQKGQEATPSQQSLSEGQSKYPKIIISRVQEDPKNGMTSLNGSLCEADLLKAGKISRGNSELSLFAPDDVSSYSSLSHYDSLKKQVEDYRNRNVKLQKKAENYYLQIEELNGALKLANENLDAIQNRCITLQKELQNKVKLENFVQSLLKLINTLEQKMEKLLEDNSLLRKTSQENIITITKLRNQIERETQHNSVETASLSNVDESPENGGDIRGSTVIPKLKGTASALELDFIKKEYEEKMVKIVEAKEMEIEQEKIKSKNQTDKYSAHLEMLGRKIHSLVTVNESLGRDLEVLKAEFKNYKIVVVSILQEASKGLSYIKNYDSAIQTLLGTLLEGGMNRSVDVVRLRELYGMLSRDVASANKLLEERKSLV